jgi:hypothetical protein
VVGPASTPLVVTIKVINRILENELVLDLITPELFTIALIVNLVQVGNRDLLLVRS